MIWFFGCATSSSTFSGGSSSDSGDTTTGGGGSTGGGTNSTAFVDGPPDDLGTGWTFIASAYGYDYNWRMGPSVMLDDAFHSIEAWDHIVVDVDGDSEDAGWANSGSPLMEHSGLCRVGTSVYVLGGGGSGVFGDWYDPETEVADLNSGSWEESIDTPFPYHHPGVTPFGPECFMVGGASQEVGLNATSLVQSYDPKKGIWSVHSSYPFDVQASGLVTLDDGRLFSAGGAEPSGSGEATTHGWATSRSFLLDPNKGDWEEVASLPEPLAGAQMRILGDDVWLLGGGEQW